MTKKFMSLKENYCAELDLVLNFLDPTPGMEIKNLVIA